VFPLCILRATKEYVLNLKIAAPNTSNQIVPIYSWLGSGSNIQSILDLLLFDILLFCCSAVFLRVLNTFTPFTTSRLILKIDLIIFPSILFLPSFNKISIAMYVHMEILVQLQYAL
jgi:hypothetical protein